MKIGIYIDSPLPNVGGTYTLLETIRKDIASFVSQYELFVFYCDPSANERYSANQITYVNLSYYFKKPILKPTFWFRVKRKIMFLLFKKVIPLITSPDVTIDNIFHEKGIDFLWILSPNDIKTTIPFAFTVWDLGHRTLPGFPEVSGPVFWSREKMYAKMLAQAVYIITGNTAGKKEILSCYPVLPDKIHIIPFPIPSFCFGNNIEDNTSFEKQIKTPFIFYPAQFWAHKNHIALIEAMAWLKQQNIKIFCYFIGYNHGNLEYINSVIKKYNLDDQIFVLGFVSRDELVFLYKNALAMVFPSLLGPNNLPPLEAMALGCPLLYSDLPGHLEQMEGNGLSFNPSEPIDIGKAISKVYLDPALRNNLKLRGLEFTQKYKTFSYFEQMRKIIDSFILYSKAWRNN